MSLSRTVLVNFRPSSARRDFLSTRLTLTKRQEFTTTEANWPRDDAHLQLQELVGEFAADVGLGLDVQLYREGIATLIDQGNQHLVPVMSGAKKIGHHEMHLLREDTGLAVTALSSPSDYRVHLRRLLATTALQSMAWVNLRLGIIHFEELTRQNHGG